MRRTKRPGCSYLPNYPHRGTGAARGSPRDAAPKARRCHPAKRNRLTDDWTNQRPRLNPGTGSACRPARSVQRWATGSAARPAPVQASQREQLPLPGTGSAWPPEPLTPPRSVSPHPPLASLPEGSGTADPSSNFRRNPSPTDTNPQPTAAIVHGSPQPLKEVLRPSQPTVYIGSKRACTPLNGKPARPQTAAFSLKT